MIKLPRRHIIAAVIIAVLAILTALLPKKPLTAVFLAVGDGMCVVAETPYGHSIVIDCGNQNTEDEGRAAAMIAERCLSRMGKSRIDLLFITHPHKDHFSGLELLLRRKPAKRIFVPYYCSSGDNGYMRVVDEACAYGAELIRLEPGQNIQLGKGCGFMVYAPCEKHENENDNSLMMKLTANRRSIMITGDAETEEEGEAMATGLNLNAEVLQVGHHGSKSSTSEEFLRAVAPMYAVISCKGSGRFKFPSPETTEKLDKCRVETYITGRDGAVTVELWPTGVKIKKESEE